jgi:hypothetical protein
MGLLVTAHSPLGLPTLCQTEVTVSKADQIVAELLGHHASWLNSRPVRETAGYGNLLRLDQLLACHQGNMREVLMELYDKFEQFQATPTGSNPRKPA